MTRSTGAGAAPTTRPGSYQAIRSIRMTGGKHNGRTHLPRGPVYLPADPNRERFMKWVPIVLLALVLLVFAGGIS